MDKKRILRQLQGQSVTAYEFATAKAQELGTVTVIAVVDESGHLIAFRRIDNAALLSVEVAQRKAYTSLMAMPPQAFANVIKDDPVMVGAIQRLPRTPLRRRAAHPC